MDIQNLERVRSTGGRIVNIINLPLQVAMQEPAIQVTDIIVAKYAEIGRLLDFDFVVDRDFADQLRNHLHDLDVEGQQYPEWLVVYELPVPHNIGTDSEGNTEYSSYGWNYCVQNVVVLSDLEDLSYYMQVALNDLLLSVAQAEGKSIYVTK